MGWSSTCLGATCCTLPPLPHLVASASAKRLAHSGDSRFREGGECLRPTVAQDPAQLQADSLIRPVPAPGDGQVDFEEFVTLLGPKLSTSGIPEKFHGTDFDTVFWKVCPGWSGT